MLAIIAWQPGSGQSTQALLAFGGERNGNGVSAAASAAYQHLVNNGISVVSAAAWRRQHQRNGGSVMAWRKRKRRRRISIGMKSSVANQYAGESGE